MAEKIPVTGEKSFGSDIVVKTDAEIDRLKKELERAESSRSKQDAWGFGEDGQSSEDLENYFNSRPSDGIVRDEHNGGFRHTDGKFASQDAHDKQNGVGEYSPKGRDAVPGVEFNGEPVNYTDLSGSAIKLAREAAKARLRGDSADEEEIMRVYEDRMLDEAAEREGSGGRAEEEWSAVEAEIESFKQKIALFEKRLAALEAKSEESLDIVAPEASAEIGDSEQEDDPEGDDTEPERDSEDSSEVDFSEKQASRRADVMRKTKEQLEESIAADGSPENREAWQNKLAKINRLFDLMESSENERGRLFASPNHFIRFNNLDGIRENFEPGFDSGFEQGQKVNVRRTDGSLEDDWVFMGLDPSGRALVRKSSEEGQLIDKSISIDSLRGLNEQADQDGDTEAGGDDAEREGQSEAEKEETRTKLQRIKEKFSPYYWGSRFAVMKMKLSEAYTVDESASEKEKKEALEKKRRHKIIGTAAIVAAGALTIWAIKQGIDSAGLADASPDAGGLAGGLEGGEAPSVENLNVVGSDLGLGEFEASNGPEITPEYVDSGIEYTGFDISPGVGGIEMMQDLGLTERDWYSVAEELQKLFPDEFYREGTDIRISKPGPLSDGVQQFIKSRFSL